jgi:starvation-inducible outer membrane lipoprotein
MFYTLIGSACRAPPRPVPTAWLLTAAVVLTACASGPPELAGSRQRMIDAQDRYDTCTMLYDRKPSQCSQALAAYRSEAARYRAEIDAKCGGNDRCAAAPSPR